MAQHVTNATLQTWMSTTLGSLYPYQLLAVYDALTRIKHVEAQDGQNGAGESTIQTIFASSGPNP